MDKLSAVSGVGALALAAGLVGFLLAPFKPAGAASAAAGTLKVQGQSTLNVAPNQATLSLGDLEQSKTASSAMSESASITQQIIRAIEKSGVKAKQIQTSGLNLNPVYGSSSPNGSPPVTGYQVSDTITVTLNQVSMVGPVIDIATAAGANQINGVTFGVSDLSTWYRHAYQSAMADARQQAEAVLAPEHLKILGIRSITTQNGGTGVIVNESARFAAALPAPTPVMPGQTQFTTQVAVVYKIGG